MNKNITKSVLLLALPVFLAANATFAKAETSYFDVTRISIPADVGKVTETYKPSEPQTVKRYIIHIQDLHCNYQAQKNLSSILENLYKTYKIDTILVEGGTGDVSLAFLRKEGPKDVRLKVAEKYLQKGLISGEEYLDIVSDYPLTLRGIEDEDLYQKNIDAFFAVEEVKTKALDHVYALRGVVNSLKPYVYGEELLELDNKSTNYHQDKMKMVDFITYLSNVSKRKNISLRDYPNVEKIAELKKIEATIDFKKADLQKNKLIEELSTKAPKPTIENLKAKALQFKDGKITQVEFYLYLQTTAKTQNINLKLYPDLANYISYISGSKQIDAKSLFNEIVQLEEKIKEKLIVKEEQKKLSGIATNIRLLIDLIKLKLTPDEYERYRQHRADINLAEWQGFLKQELSQYNVAATMPGGAELVQQNIVKFETFYEVAVKRDDALINNAINAMKQLGKDRAVLITGGFHTEKMTDKLKSEGFSFAIVAPKAAATADQEKLYLEVMRYKESHKLREADKLRSPAAKNRGEELREITGAMHEAVGDQASDSIREAPNCKIEREGYSLSNATFENGAQVLRVPTGSKINSVLIRGGASYNSVFADIRGGVIKFDSRRKASPVTLEGVEVPSAHTLMDMLCFTNTANKFEKKAESIKITKKIELGGESLVLVHSSYCHPDQLLLPQGKFTDTSFMARLDEFKGHNVFENGVLYLDETELEKEKERDADYKERKYLVPLKAEYESIVIKLKEGGFLVRRRSADEENADQNMGPENKITGAMHEGTGNAGFIDKDDEAYQAFADRVEKEIIDTQKLYEENNWGLPAQLPEDDQKLIKKNARQYFGSVGYDRLEAPEKEILVVAGINKKSFDEMKARIVQTLDEIVINATVYKNISLYWVGENKYAVGYLKGNSLTVPWVLLFRKIHTGKEHYLFAIMARLIAHELGYSNSQAYAMQRILAPELVKFIVELAGEDKDIKMLMAADEETARLYLKDPRNAVKAAAEDRESSFIIERIKTGPKEYAQQYTKDKRDSVAGEATDRLKQIKKQEDTKNIVAANEAAEEAAIKRQKENGNGSLTGNGTQNPEVTLVFKEGEKEPAAKALPKNKKDSTRVAKFDDTTAAPEKAAKKPAQVVKKDTGALVAVFNAEAVTVDKIDLDTSGYKSFHRIAKDHLVRAPKGANGKALILLDELAKNYPALVWARANNIQTLAKQKTQRYVIIDENDLGATEQERNAMEKKLRGKRIGDVSLLVVAPDIEGKTAEEIFKNFKGLSKENTIFMLSVNSKIKTGTCPTERFETQVLGSIINDIVGNISTKEAKEIYDGIKEQTKALEFV